MRELSAGIIGFGFMGRAHTFGYRNLSLYYDPPPIRLKRLVMCASGKRGADAAGTVGLYDDVVTDWRRLIDDGSIDIIHVCTPNHLHAEMIIAAIEAGKYVYCDKPLTATYEQARQVEEALGRAKYDRTSQLALQLRFFPATLRAKQLVDEGFLGDVLSFRASYLHNSNIDPNRVLNWKADKLRCGGGVLLDLGAHILDLVTHLCGPVHRIWCRTDIFTAVRPDGKGGTVDIEAEDLALMVVELANGAVGTIEASKVGSGTNDDACFEIHGRDGAMKFASMEPNWLGVYDGRTADEPLGGRRGYTQVQCVRRFESPGGKFPGPKFSIGFLEAHAHCLYNFLAGVAGDEPVEPSLRTGVRLQYWLDLAYRSAADSQWQDAK